MSWCNYIKYFGFFPSCRYSILNGNHPCLLKMCHGHEFWTCFIMNYLLKLFLLSNLVIRTRNWYRPTGFLPARVLDSSYHSLESCWIDVLYLTQFIDKGFALVLAQTLCLHSLMDSDIGSHHVPESYIPACLGSLGFSSSGSQLSAQDCRHHAPSS
jgi:hypothetical protein